jgi:hypothetical protein
MPINTYLIGNDGAVTLTSGTVVQVRSYAATLERPESDLTGFADTGRRRRVGMLDLTGSLSGVPAIDSTASTTSSSFFVSTATAALTLTLFDATTTADAKIAANCIFNAFAFNVDKVGDSTLSCNFSNGDGAAPVVTWLV